MNQKEFKRFKLEKVASKDTLRPALGVVHFENGYAYATDGRIVARISLKVAGCFTDEEIAMLNGKNVTAQCYELMRKSESIKVFATYIRMKTHGTFVETEYIKNLKFPNVEKVIADAIANKQKEPITKIGMQAKLVKNLSDAFNENVLYFYFTGHNGIVVVNAFGFDHERVVGVIMPTTIE